MITLSLISFGQKYSISLIPDSLRANASVIKRLDETTIEVKSPAKAIVHEHMVYTILGEQGNPYASFRSYYDKFVDIISISGTLYDGKGR
jgi:hypothetical protein